MGIYAIVNMASIPLNFSVYSGIEIPLAYGVSTIATMSSGFILALIYFTSLREELR